ncbi:uncharacterized protein MONBRDRAFT_28161 [Monosiga brevicollis MX1]|uniref:tRNA(Phe) (4-demethylwyosine(37)-C(7)) aminocarboxypropyltransferase n=1 Tax=Monosiga brevicollis TaxID=81824 RepID=A9V7D5_MONBE|nr:uncharacterized protein MONBRDRAFT_28161 [Monosiga brevicollis MX1]EDQ86566.1 predicted protein [Monosiga brevicollis MX1]|eukprot:XP_001748679.1 hypothetical protein [Monosiga brevicollis MX1]
MMEGGVRGPAVVVVAGRANEARRTLEALGVYDASRKIGRGAADDLPADGAGLLLVPVTPAGLADTETAARIGDLGQVLAKVELDASLKQRVRAEKPQQRLLQALQAWCAAGDPSLVKAGAQLGQSDALPLPPKFEVHGDLVMFPASAFSTPQWHDLRGREGFWACVAGALGKERVAIRRAIADNLRREAQVELVLGADGWVEHVDNRVRYTYDVTRCMFSAGNISEKLRVAALPCADEVVVDLFAGIGYFTLPYLVHARARFLHACEWNPHAVEALRRNLKLNQVADRCEVHEGDNRQVAPVGCADRVNLGLIPTSKESWATALACLRPDRGGMLHVHENVTTGEGEQNEAVWALFGAQLCADLTALSAGRVACTVQHIECVKSYAPRIYHMRRRRVRRCVLLKGSLSAEQSKQFQSLHSNQFLVNIECSGNNKSREPPIKHNRGQRRTLSWRG